MPKDDKAKPVEYYIMAATTSKYTDLDTAVKAASQCVIGNPSYKYMVVKSVAIIEKDNPPTKVTYA